MDSGMDSGMVRDKSVTKGDGLVLSQTIKLKQFSQEDRLNADVTLSILRE